MVIEAAFLPTFRALQSSTPLMLQILCSWELPTEPRSLDQELHREEFWDQDLPAGSWQLLFELQQVLLLNPLYRWEN